MSEHQSCSLLYVTYTFTKLDFFVYLMNILKGRSYSGGRKDFEIHKFYIVYKMGLRVLSADN